MLWVSVPPIRQGCIERIHARGVGSCEPQYMEWLKCIDKHVSPESARCARPGSRRLLIVLWPLDGWDCTLRRSLGLLAWQSAKKVLKALK
jgi:hypothetical protein